MYTLLPRQALVHWSCVNSHHLWRCFLSLSLPQTPCQEREREGEERRERERERERDRVILFFIFSQVHVLDFKLVSWVSASVCVCVSVCAGIHASLSSRLSSASVSTIDANSRGKHQGTQAMAVAPLVHSLVIDLCNNLNTVLFTVNRSLSLFVSKILWWGRRKRKHSPLGMRRRVEASKWKKKTSLEGHLHWKGCFVMKFHPRKWLLNVQLFVSFTATLKRSTRCKRASEWATNWSYVLKFTCDLSPLLTDCCLPIVALNLVPWCLAGYDI